MKLSLQRQLFERFPIFLRNTEENSPLAHRGIEVDDGWYLVLMELFGKFEKHLEHEVAAGVDEKRLISVFAVYQDRRQLEISLNYCGDLPDYLQAAIESAKAAAILTCAECGKPRHFISMTRCEPGRKPFLNRSRHQKGGSMLGSRP